jgi:OOP family OmpA-OmpF porin
MKIINFGMLAASIVFSGSVYAGAYAGAGAGRSDVDADAGFSSFSDTDTGWKIFGGYAFNKYFAVEGAWVDLGDFSDTVPDPLFFIPTKMNLELDGFAVSGVGSYPVNEAFTIFGKLGIWSWESDVSIPVLGLSADDDGTDVMFGAGGSYSFTKAIAVRAEWERFTADSDDTDLFSISGVYSF